MEYLSSPGLWHLSPAVQNSSAEQEHLSGSWQLLMPGNSSSSLQAVWPGRAEQSELEPHFTENKIFY